jgi:hypothetical protein
VKFSSLNFMEMETSIAIYIILHSETAEVQNILPQVIKGSLFDLELLG